jgi:uncharacterized protein (DUF305 family)
MMKLHWTRWGWKISAALFLVIVLLFAPAVAAREQRTYQMGPGGLEQLSGDAFDQAFLSQMAMHHAMGIAMTRPVVANGGHQDLKDLAAAMMAAQASEIDQMVTWLGGWFGIDASWVRAMPHPMMPGMMPVWGPAMPGATRPGGMLPASGMPMMGPGLMMPGGPMAGMPMMTNTRDLTPDQLDASFMLWMIAHHQAAIDMAGLAAERAEHQEVKDLAASIIATQSAEIETMRGWLADWYGL